LGMTAQDAQALKDILLQKILTEPAILKRRDEFGQRYVIDFELEWEGNRAILRSGWIIENHNTEPKLTTCYPL